MPTYVLTGVDGHLSSVAASYALTLAKPTDTLTFTSPKPGFVPRPLLASWTARGARVLMVDYNDPANLERAFRGADVVAFVSSPNYLAGPARRAQHRNVVEAARRAGVGRLVYTSIVGAELGEDAAPPLARDHAYTEALVRASGLEWNVQRNCLFVDTVAEVFAPPGRTSAGIDLGGKECRAAFVAREDCGRVLGALLMGKGEANKVYTVTGPRAVSNKEILRWMAARAGGVSGDSCPVSPVSDHKPEVVHRERRLSAGASMHGDFFGRYSNEGLEDLASYGRFISHGQVLQGTDTVARLTGQKPLSFEDSLGSSACSFSEASMDSILAQEVSCG
ncbi:NAD(P)-binding protein [Cryphonectria parasitica EP155]|uniref:NAD(P)-binding protein n=1 Tax=Cryphonectria parasitica (strain ATCC 38755 / EP155) TaxID=660469 RepID=A0A9P5CSQ1_CRYP1|nr:NAD(P)-binding protein [Cryphonectria parasitica EP155]KAF3768591.1 NAD(P)-binding protein [Cryphonectria parasitica EP155]